MLALIAKLMGQMLTLNKDANKATASAGTVAFLILVNGLGAQFWPQAGFITPELTDLGWAADLALTTIGGAIVAYIGTWMGPKNRQP